MASTGAPVRLAMPTVSPRWSAWPCVSRMVVGSSSSGEAAAFGLPVRKGSIRSRVSPSVNSNAEWPRKRMSMGSVLPVAEAVGQLIPHRDADEHADPRLLDDRALHGAEPFVDVRLARRVQHGGLVRRSVPLRGGERLVEDALELRRGGRHDALRLLEAAGLRHGLDRRVDL